MEKCHLEYYGLIIKGEKRGLKIKNLQKCVIILFMFLFSIFSYPIICAQNYYADIEISVDESGVVDIEGISNYPDFLVQNSHLYTYKKQSYWLLNITKEEVFSDYIYVLTLPEGSKINHVKTSGFRGIEEEDGKLIISGAGQNESLSIVVQYQVNKTSDEQSLIDFIILLALILSIIILTGLLIYFILKDKQKGSLGSDANVVGKGGYNFKGLSERQKEIVQLLIDAKRPLTQVEIQKELDMPKAAVSRNVHSLEIKGLIEIEKIGMSNLIRLKKP